VKRLPHLHNALPASGLCAFVRAAAMAPIEGDRGYPHAPHPITLTRRLSAGEDAMHPGEGSA
jgi:hypothetical protein